MIGEIGKPIGLHVHDLAVIDDGDGHARDVLRRHEALRLGIDGGG
jgi:hypothetical protein